MLVKVLGVLALANAAMAICPGFNFGIGNVLKFTNGNSQWAVYNDSCDVVDGLFIGPDQNPCTQGIFGCSPAPIIFNRYTSTHTGLIYSCRRDVNSGKCGRDVISVCCRNDGH